MADKLTVAGAVLILSISTVAQAQQPPPAAGQPPPRGGVLAPTGGPMAGPPAGAPVQLNTESRATALAAIEQAIEKSYLFTELRKPLVEQLERAKKSGRYDTSDPLLFAERISEDLKATSHDAHLAIHYAPPQYGAALAPRGSDAGMEVFMRKQAIRHHHGLSELSALPGNVRYLKISDFEWVRGVSNGAYDDALRFLRDGDAIIIDLRGNGGGWPSAVQYLTSFFVEPNTLLMSFQKGSEAPSESRSLANLPADSSLKGKPLYVLIDDVVASAAEEFAYHVQQFKLGELIGAKTAGAANNPVPQPIAPGFMLNVPVGRPIHPVSHANWEGVGIKPSIETAPQQALDVALATALKRLSQDTRLEPPVKAEYAWALATIEARQHPVMLNAERMKALAGRYQDVTVTVRDKALWLAQPDRAPRRLLPLSADGLFAVEGLDSLRVRITSKTLELQQQRAPAPLVLTKAS